MKNLKTIISLVVCIFILSVVSNDVKAQKKKKTETITISVEMSCPSCVNKIEKGIAYEKGVKDLIVSYEKETVIIKYKTKKTTQEKLLKAIEKLGYTANIVKINENTDLKNK